MAPQPQPPLPHRQERGAECNQREPPCSHPPAIIAALTEQLDTRTTYQLEVQRVDYAMLLFRGLESMSLSLISGWLCCAS